MVWLGDICLEFLGWESAACFPKYVILISSWGTGINNEGSG